jgi:hypothetical protein
VVLSAPADANLLLPRSWTLSTPLPFDTGWLPRSWGTLPQPGYLEGNVVEHDGALYDLLRLNRCGVRCVLFGGRFD